MTKPQTPTITCFGEILWDVLPTAKQPGGAPMNVAADLRNFGINAQLISRVGDDALGDEMLDFLAQKQLPPALVQRGNGEQTGVAKANLSDANAVTYTIVQPAAWDFIEPKPQLVEAVRTSTFFVYGSLAARSPQTHQTLLELLAVAPRTIFDVNLRAPFYSKTLIEQLLQPADIVKLNETELAQLAEWFGYTSDLQGTMEKLRQDFALDAVLVTLGEKGAALLDASRFVQQGGFAVTVADTIGSGDAFLAAYLYKTLQGASAQETLRFACATGAYVATQSGATPSFDVHTIESFLASKS